jgi:hypothetical protein
MPTPQQARPMSPLAHCRPLLPPDRNAALNGASRSVTPVDGIVLSGGGLCRLPLDGQRERLGEGSGRLFLIRHNPTGLEP